VSALICVTSLAWRLTTIHVLDFPGKYNYAATETRMESIVWGCMLSLGLHLYPTARIWQRLTGVLPLAFALGLLLFAFLYRDEAFRETFRYTVQGAALFICVLNLFFWRPLRPVVGMLEFAPVAWTGRVSYGLYLWHMPALMISHSYLGFEVGTVSYMLFGVAFSFALAALSHYAVEQPVMGLRRRFGSHAVGGKARVALDTVSER
jgi:peptidoglycan/LPS O-acetylase OafA/YrhL